MRYRISVKRIKEKDNSESLGVDGRIILKVNLIAKMWEGVD
jgi:hypothetical protein